ncbi:hypothetical protein A6J88_02895 [Neisseria mucosa]|uniref:Transposase n=1 Tax=Neisseria mucosa TaxID=488 RepID=A0ABN4Y1Z5_NEIMU|nr:hypothetical protein A6J88_02895 [Neisseria mucosa]
MGLNPRNLFRRPFYSGLTLNQDKATKPQTVQIVRQGEATPYWFKVNPLYICWHFTALSMTFGHMGSSET